MVLIQIIIKLRVQLTMCAHAWTTSEVKMKNGVHAVMRCARIYTDTPYFVNEKQEHCLIQIKKKSAYKLC
jgi:hypothetical protein